MHTKRLTITYVALAAALLGLFALNLFWGSVAISPRGVVQALLGRGQDELAANILLQLRLPRGAKPNLSIIQADMLWIEMKAETAGQPVASASKIRAASSRERPEPPTSSPI